MIEFKNVSKTYDNREYVLRDVNLKIDDGEFVFIVGKSGSGKTTLTKLLLREEKVTSGRIIINGFRLDKMRQGKVPYLRRQIGMVFQDFRLFPKKNVYENVAFAMEVIGASSSSIKKRVPFFLNLVGLSNKMKSFPTQLSGGEQQRVALARAIVNNPNIIIADEPTGNLDPEMSREIMELLMTLNEKLGKTVIVVTHEQSLVNKYNKRVITIGEGGIESDIPRKVSEAETVPEEETQEMSESSEAQPEEDVKIYGQENGSEDSVEENEAQEAEDTAAEENTDNDGEKVEVTDGGEENV